MKKVVILGSTGMLGHMVADVLKRNSSLNVEPHDRTSIQVTPRTLNRLGSVLSRLCEFGTDYLINCIGAIKPTFMATSNPADPIYTNAVFPHQLANWCNLTHTKLIHITTDCVYDGAKGQYVESDPHNALDIYGKSKSIGEPENAMVLRTSIIGPEQGGRKRSLLEWIKSQAGGEINGFTNHMWNGLTTLELARSLNSIIDNDLWTEGTSHLFSSDVTKHAMVEEIAYQYGLGINISPMDAPQAVDRTLRTEKMLQLEINPQPFDVMVAELVEWESERR
jgi:dTDP-4-dehydrorhamnose reductase